MKDLTHYFQSPASSAKKSTSNGEETGSKAQSGSVDELPHANGKPVDNSQKKKKVLSLKRASENGKSKDKHSSKQPADDKETKTPEIDKKSMDSPNPSKKRGRSKKTGVASPDSEVETKTNISQVTNGSRVSTNKTPDELTCDKVANGKTPCRQEIQSCNDAETAAYKNKNKSASKHRHQDDSKNNTSDATRVSDVEMTDLTIGSTLETNHTDLRNADTDTKTLSSNKKSQKHENVEMENIKKQNVTKSKDVEKSFKNQDKKLSTKCSIETVAAKHGSDSEEERVIKKLKLELEATSPRDNAQTKMPNAFQVMMSGGSKKSINIEKKTDESGDTSLKDTKSKLSKSSKKEESSKKGVKSKEGSPTIDKLSKNDTKNAKTDVTKASNKSAESPTVFKEKEDKANMGKDEHNKSHKVKESSKSSSDFVQKKKESENNKKKETPKSEKIKDSDNLGADKGPDVFKLIMTSKKECKVQEDNIYEEKETKKSHRSNSKRKFFIENDESDDKETEELPKPKDKCVKQKSDKIKKKDNFTAEKSSGVCKLKSSKKECKKQKEDVCEEKERKKSRRSNSKRKNIIESDESSNNEIEELPTCKEVLVKQNEADKVKKKEILTAEKSPDAFKLLMSSKKESKEKQEDVCEGKTKKSCRSKSKKKNTFESDESDDHEIEELPKPEDKPVKQNKPSGLFEYFSPVSREEARKRANEILVIKTITAEVHQEPKEHSPEENKRHSLGPKRRSQQSQKEVEEEIIVLSVEETQEIPSKPKKTFKFKTPEKKKKRRPWQLKVKLLSPAKPMENSSTDTSGSSCSDSDSDVQEVSVSPRKKQGNLKALWAARGKDTRLAPIFMSKSRNTSVQSTKGLSKGDRKIVSVPAMPFMRPAPTEHTIGFAEVDPATPMSVLFPSISHITQSEKKEGNTDPSISFPSSPIKEVPVCPTISPGSLINTNESSQEVSTPLKLDIKVNRDSEENGESWCEKHKPITAVNIAGNAKSVQRLKVWLEGWRQRSIISDDKSHKSSDSESSEYSSDDDFIVSDDDSNSDGRSKKKKKKKKHCNTALLVGPCGSGKTASVYAVAEELGFKVLEMNASSRRSGKRILSELQEATQSHQVRNNAVDQDTVNSFFGASSKDKDKTKNQITESQQQGNNSGLSVILVEDVDVVFEEQDEGFLAALNVLAASSKRPLILVSNEPQCPLLLARQHRLHLEFKPVPSSVIGGVVKQICSTEGECLGDHQLQHIMKICKGDLRQAVLFAQTWTLTGGFPQIPTKEMLPFPLNLSSVWSAMKHIPLPYILHEDDIVIEEENKEPKSEQNSDSDHIFSPPKKKPKAKRLRLTSDSIGTWEPTQGTSCPDLKKMLYFSDMLATLDVIQGSLTRELNFSYTRPGLSDQPCYDAVPDRLGPILQHWLASKAVISSDCSLVFNTSEQRDRWRETHHAVDQSLLEQLPLFGQLDHRAAALDLLPALRDLGRSEQSSGRVSRRSRINALNSLGFHPGGITVETLPFIFPNDSDNS